MKKFSFLIMQWLLISCLVMAGISAITQGVTAGTAGQGSGFTLSNLVVSPAEVETGQTITISATVKETNNVSGAYEGTLRINGIIEETQIISVSSSESKQITFTSSRNEAGVYTIDLDGLIGSFTVTGEAIIDSSDSSFPTVPVVIGIIVAIVIVGLIVFYLNRRRAA